MSDIDAELRKTAEKRLKAKAEFWSLVGVWAAVTVITVGVWFITGQAGGYFWPIWPIFGVGIGVLFTGLNAFVFLGRFDSEAAIQREMDRLRGN